MLDLTTPCVEWTGTRSKDGYGKRWWNGRSGALAHRVAYLEQVGPIPDGLELDHLCRNRACVNVHHLEPVTRRENTLRGEGFPAVNARKTHCPKGHPYDEANTYVLRERTQTRRCCRACNRAAALRYQRARQAS